MRGLVWISLALCVALPAAAMSAEDAKEASEEAAPKCLEAAVNPVTGHTFCVNPRGAPVEPPPPEAYNRPCKPRAHDDDPWTMYEHHSGC